MWIKSRIRVLSPVVGALLLLVAVAIAQKPVKNVNPAHHPNIAAAQQLSQQAFEKIVAAQEANEWDMQGHAQHAKQLLQQANNELRAAATAANQNAK
jgi:hypothetical protein